MTFILLTTVVLLLLLLPTGPFPLCLNLAALLVTGWMGLRHFIRPASDQTALGRMTLPAIAILALLLLSLVPLPLAVTQLTGTTRYTQNAQVAHAIQTLEAREILPAAVQPSFSLSRNRAGTVRVLLLVATMLACMSLAGSLPGAQRLGLLRLLVSLGAGVAIAGVVARNHVPQGDTLWWCYPIPAGLPGPLVCFTNQNHFAGLMVLLLPAAAGLILNDLDRRHWVRLLLSTALLGALLLGLSVSHSRGALIAGGVGGLSLILLLMLHHRFKTAIVLGLGAILLAGALWTQMPPVYRQRLNDLREWRSEDSVQTRVTAWRDSLAIMKNYPLLGAGANGFRMVYPQYRSTDEGSFMTHAENEYVQLAVDGGIAGLLLALWLLVALTRHAWVPMVQQRQETAMMLASLGATAVAATHALFDFALHIPIYGVFLACLLGLGFPQSERIPATTGPMPRNRIRLPMVFALLALIAALYPTLYFRNDMDLDRVRRRDLDYSLRTLTAAPTSSWGWYYLGRLVEDQPHSDAIDFAAWCMERALLYDANNYRLWYNYGLARLRADDRDGARKAFDRARDLRGWGWGGSVELGEEAP